MVTRLLAGHGLVGRDVLTRLVFGARVSLLVGFSTVILGAIVGLVLGLLSGFYGGWLDNLIMRLADAQLAFPFMLLAIAIIAVLGPNLRNLILVLAVSSWVLYAWLVRGDVLAVKKREFVDAALWWVSAMSVSWVATSCRTSSTLLVIATFSVAQMILAEAALSDFGLGVQLPTPAWG